ncbi:hypothetical protein ACFLV2_02585 [Chloroflexota bacterium]
MNKKLIITLVIIGLLLGYYYIGNGYLKQRRQQETLAVQITTATLALAQLPVPPVDLEQRLATANAGLEAARDNFPDAMNSTRIIDSLLKLAESSGVKAVPLVTQAWTQQKVGEHDYNVFRLNLTVEGSFSDFTGFLNKVEIESYATLVVEDLRLSRPEEPSEEESAASRPETGDLISASLDIIVFTQSPPPE